MRIIGDDQKNKGQSFWEILERIIGKISSIIGAGLVVFSFLHIYTYIYWSLNASYVYIYSYVYNANGKG